MILIFRIFIYLGISFTAAGLVLEDMFLCFAGPVMIGLGVFVVYARRRDED